jgi:hypothetical protein
MLHDAGRTAPLLSGRHSRPSGAYSAPGRHRGNGIYAAPTGLGPGAVVRISRRTEGARDVRGPRSSSHDLWSQVVLSLSLRGHRCPGSPTLARGCGCAASR